MLTRTRGYILTCREEVPGDVGPELTEGEREGRCHGEEVEGEEERGGGEADQNGEREGLEGSLAKVEQCVKVTAEMVDRAVIMGVYS